MAIYRAESGRRIAIATGAAAILGLVLGLLLGRLTAPGIGAQLADLRTQAAPLVSSLEVIRTEYPKLLAGGSDSGGAAAAMARIETVFAAIRPSLTEIDQTDADGLEDAIAALRKALDDRVPDAELGTRLDDVKAAFDAILPG